MRSIIDKERFTCDPETNTLTLHHDWQSDESVSTAIVMGLAAVTNTPSTELNPLYEFVNPDALDQLYQSIAPNSDEHRPGYVAFRAHECDVVAYSTGTIKITPQDDEAN